ncbi:hypothetical protein GCM10009789_76330 [Kribbella sancticallisti]|uniref:Transposase n=1 Tax=Kribbella sancticallisti TaxID=460087 RepID=A0ABN2ELN6_9ACTN
MIHAKKRGLNRKAGPPVHDDLVKRVFTAPAPNRVWLTGDGGSEYRGAVAAYAVACGLSGAPLQSSGVQGAFATGDCPEFS